MIIVIIARGAPNGASIGHHVFISPTFDTMIDPNIRTFLPPAQLIWKNLWSFLFSVVVKTFAIFRVGA